MISARNKYLFTPNQWQELEHQALIFKYMVSGVPIPPQLLYSVKTSFDSSLASHLFPHQPTGWGCFQVGFGRKPDPEPGRCRRTDGKKWRCSKEAYPDSKYCLSVPSHHFLDSGTGIDYPQTDKLYRYVHGTREGVDERSFFPEASGSVRVVPDSYQPLTMVQSFGDNNVSKQGQQCFVLGTDIKSAKPIKLEKDEGTQKPVHQFLGDWTQGNNNGSWLDLASNSRIVEVSIMESIKALE
ncbi:growth-regulating factor 5-like isoform X1 [Gossypium australe]|uniref:Growth-regulating factor n=1 Tax=Gossypium australe TaxID=47621 RepID=A0A5B6WDI7_9ROSI|nr:growth-regulating factor 5-like isoform X1 [Gossypium australe]